MKCFLSLLHSQSSYTYSSTFTIPGSIDYLKTMDNHKNQQIFYYDYVITSLMIVIRMSYFLPKIVLRLYSLLKEEQSEITKSKNRYILTELNGMVSSDQRNSVKEFIQGKGYSDDARNSLRKLYVKNIVVNHPIPVIILILANVWGYSVILYLFMN
jgi:hypothetical protein